MTCKNVFHLIFPCANNNNNNNNKFSNGPSLSALICHVTLQGHVSLTLAIMEGCVGLGVMGSIASVYQVLWAQDAKVCFLYLFQVSVHFPILIQ